MEYRFGSFRLKPSVRELWHDDRLSPLPRRVFDAMAYLVEHRERAVGRDELVAAIWGRVDVSDAQVNQLMLRARRALGDDGHSQHVIRTVPGFGYRWILPVELEDDGERSVGRTPAGNDAQPAAGVGTDTTEVDPVAVAGVSETADGADRVPTVRTLPQRKPRRIPVLALLAVTAVLCTLTIAFTSRVTDTRAAPTPVGETVAVLPIAVDAPEEMAWVRLGAMDLVAGRLRSAGLPVALSESVLTALDGRRSATDGVASLDDATRARLERTLGAGLIVKGRALHRRDGWTLELEAATPGGTRHRVAAQHDEVVEAARAAADRLLAALGRIPPPPTGAQDALAERIQQARAALLAGEIDAARAILVAAPDPDDPRVLLRLAQVDVRAGKLDEAEAALTALLDHPGPGDDAMWRASVLLERASLRFRRGDFKTAEADFDAAASLLDAHPEAPELARALSGRGIARVGLGKLDQAAGDLGRARIQYQRIGERLGIAQVDANLGLLEANREHLDQALPYLVSAAKRFEDFGAVERVLGVRSAVFDVQALLLRWREALATTDMQWSVRDRAGDPGLGLTIMVQRARALAALGRLREAEALRDAAHKQFPGVRAQARRYLDALSADLAWLRGDAPAAVASARRALADWPADVNDDNRHALALLHQRATLAARDADTGPVLAELQAVTDDAPPLPLLARAEWVASQGRAAEAERVFARALAGADARGVPAEIAQVIDGYARWLLAEGRLDEAAALAGRVAPWADHDYTCALLQLAVLHAYGRLDQWAQALAQARALAGERAIPVALSAPPQA